MKYVETPGQYEAIQWAGDNVAAIDTFVEQYRGPNWVWTEQPDGSLYGTQGMDSLLFAPYEWFVIGPTWGVEDPNSLSFKLLSAEAFSLRYDQAPENE